MKAREEKLRQITAWARQNDDVAVMLLTSSLVNPLAMVDNFSDLDVELVFYDNRPYVENRKWLSEFGNILTFVEEDEEVFNEVHAMKMVLYGDHVKVDFKLYSLAKFREEILKEALPKDWDIGYKVIVDKDRTTKDLRPPTHRASIIKKPSKEKFNQILNDYWWDTTYMAKCLARQDLFYARFMMENIIRTDYLVPLIEWFIASRNDWNVTTNKHGRFFKNYLSESEWAQLESTFAGSDMEENWQAMFAVCDVVHITGSSLARSLAFNYPAETEKNVRQYLHKIHASLA